MIGRRGPREANRDVKIYIVDAQTFGVRRRVKGVFNFKEHDPFAVHLSFFDKEGRTKAPVHWCFARELLVTGTALPTGAGVGDVSIWPIAWEDFRSYVGMVLDGGTGVMPLMMPMKPVRRFIQAMEKIVPINNASDHINVDGELTWLQRKFF